LPFGQRSEHRGGHGHSVIAGRLRLYIVPNRTQEVQESFVFENVLPGKEVQTDDGIGMACFCFEVLKKEVVVLPGGFPPGRKQNV